MQRPSTIALACTLCLLPIATAQQPYPAEASRTHPDRVYWGDTHLHTALSGDAFRFNTRLGPEEAYRFARGEEVTSNTGQPAKLRRPLDFIVVADHGNNIGAALSRHRLTDQPGFAKTSLGRLWKRALAAMQKDQNVDQDALLNGNLLPAHRPGQISVRDPKFRESVWNQITAAADRHNDPGTFTAFIGYEWTPSGELGTSDHRIVIFRDDASHSDQVVPFTSFDSAKPEDLWAYFDDYEAKTGGAVLSITHNPNLTSGGAFALTDSYGEPLTVKRAQIRARWEPVVEVTQIKGDSETHPFLSPNDEFADYETWNGWAGRTSTARGNDKIQFEYARSALKLGLGLKADLGVNPFKVGMIGSTDSHTALASVDEANYWGKMAIAEPSAKRIFNSGPATNWEAGAAGYAAVWATENTRSAIFAALKRREVYATTGPRMTVRFFGGWNYDASDANSHDPAQLGYSKGVPMGGDLAHGPSGQSPNFLIRAVKDPDGANLDRVQVIKGQRDSAGKLHEKVHNVAFSDNRDLASNEPVGSTVDIPNAGYTNSIGDPELTVVWQDPDFDPAEHAFYYVRVLEIPTPRWTAHDAKNYGLKDLPAEIPMVIQERAYTSPIWYVPK